MNVKIPVLQKMLKQFVLATLILSVVCTVSVFADTPIWSPDGRWIAAGRIMHDGAAKTDVALLDVESNTLTSLLTLPSGGDTSYPGLVWRDGVLWVSYYSSHEGKTAIYLAKVRIEP